MNALAYISFFENINKQTKKEEYEKVFHKDARFKDPFHDVQGLEKIYNVFQDMYLKLDNPKFKILEVVKKSNIIYIKWDFEFQFKGKTEKQNFEGVSRVEFNEEGKAISHIDYWDSVENLYEKIPLLSSFLRFIKNRIRS